MDRHGNLGWSMFACCALCVHVSAGHADPPPEVTRSLLDQSLQLGKSFLLNNQLPDGLFRYSYHLATGELLARQSQVRQVGTLWGLALIHQDQPSQTTRDSILRGLAFYERHSHLDGDGRRWIVFPGANGGASGSVALVSLAIIDFLRRTEGSSPDTRNAVG